MLDPITTPIAIMLGKYALDKGAELGKDVGPKALDTVKEMYAATLDHLRRTPKGEVIADEFVEDPETFEKPLVKKLEQAARDEPDFADRLEMLWQQFEEERAAYQAAQGVSYQATATSGAVAQGEGATAVGERGVNVGGDVGGSIVTGDESSAGAQDDDA